MERVAPLVWSSAVRLLTGWLDTASAPAREGRRALEPPSEEPAREARAAWGEAPGFVSIRGGAAP